MIGDKIPNYNLTNFECWCKGNDDELISELDRSGKNLRSVICKKCGTIRLDPYLDEQELIDFYNVDYLEDYNQHAISFEKMYLDNQKNNSSLLIRNIFELYDVKMQGLNILDYGGGVGGKLDAFFNDNTIDLFDASSDRMEFAEMKGYGSYTIEKKYDMIFLIHTIEHWFDFNNLTLLKKQLKDGGYLIIELPLIDRLKYGGRKKGVIGDIHFPHKWYFSTCSLNNLLKQMNFKLMHSNYNTVAIFQKKHESIKMTIDPLCYAHVQKIIRQAKLFGSNIINRQIGKIIKRIFK